MVNERLASIDGLEHDERRLHSCLEDAGRYAYGIGAVEVYLLDEDLSGKLIWKGGYLDKDSIDMDNDGDCDFFDAEPPDDVVPGTGLVGTLWNHCTSGNLRRRYRQQQQQRRHSSSSITGGGGGGGGGYGEPPSRRSTLAAFSMLSNVLKEVQDAARDSMRFSFGIGRGSQRQQDNDNDDDNNTLESQGHTLVYRDLESLQRDPFTPTSPRLEHFIQAGLVQAAGVPFEQQKIKGLVVFYVVAGAANTKRLVGKTNETYLLCSAAFIGSCIAMSKFRRSCAALNLYTHYEFGKGARHLRYTRALSSMEDSSEHHADGSTDECELMMESERLLEQIKKEQKKQQATGQLQQRVTVWYNKCLQGGGMQIPPPMELRQIVWTVFGSFCALLLLSAMDDFLRQISDCKYYIVMGPFGALITLQYALTAAPVAQPRNAIFGQCICGFITLAFTKISTRILPLLLRRALAPALAIGAMTAAGVVHPPAGASSVLWVNGNFDCIFLLIAIAAAVVSVLPAMVVNNMSNKRQYPTYWGFCKMPPVCNKENDESCKSSKCLSKQPSFDPQDIVTRPMAKRGSHARPSLASHGICHGQANTKYGAIS